MLESCKWSAQRCGALAIVERNARAASQQAVQLTKARVF